MKTFIWQLSGCSNVIHRDSDTVHSAALYLESVCFIHDVSCCRCWAQCCRLSAHIPPTSRWWRLLACGACRAPGWQVDDVITAVLLSQQPTHHLPHKSCHFLHWRHMKSLAFLFCNIDTQTGYYKECISRLAANSLRYTITKYYKKYIITKK